MINGANSTYQTGDILNGQKATNTLNLTVADATTGQVVEMNDVQVVNIRNVDTANPFTLNAGLWDGTTQIWNSRSIAAANIAVEEVGAAVAVGVRNSTAAMTVTYAEGALGSKTASQTIAVEGAEATITVNAQPNVGASTDAFTGVVIAASGSASDITLGLNDAAGAPGTASSLKSMTVTGSGELTVAFAQTEDNTITTIDASANTGGVTFDGTTAAALKTLTGGTGDDVFTIGALAASGSASLGNGDDQLLDGGVGALASTVTVDGGEGTDTIAATMLAAGNAKNVKNFEILDVAGATGTIDGSLYTASTFESLQLSAATAVGGIAVTKLAGTAVVLNVTNAAAITTQADAITATLATTTGTADTATVNFAGEADAALAEFVTTGVETVNIVSGGDDGVVNELTQLTLNDNSTTSIVITGAEDFTLGLYDTVTPLFADGVATNASATTATADVASALTLIDGSAATGNLTILAGTAVAIGTSGFNTTYNSLTINGGAGDDVISIGGRGSVDTGEGTNTVNVAVLGVSVTVGTDDEVDSVILGASADYLVAGGFTASTRITSITNMAEDDVIDFSAPLATTATTVNDFTATALAQGSLVDAVNAAVTSATSQADFFNWTDGNTYIVANDATQATVIMLTGTYTDFSIAADVITLA